MDCLVNYFNASYLNMIIHLIIIYHHLEDIHKSIKVKLQVNFYFHLIKYYGYNS